ncbi:hypothetical protein LMG29739_06345 [Paraburkholderia solisilvae]|uniref:Uncharacterized protein n=1 Tax=Paraburkholderia solisilvae TaxID=624376 RepID=A0A6J5F398_9BURK|nr:hypothetical protein LMG29739_06345 [Paraburkholderia solisilvae]
MVCQTLARELQLQGIHVVHVVIDGSIRGKKILKTMSELAHRK